MLSCFLLEDYRLLCLGLCHVIFRSLFLLKLISVCGGVEISFPYTTIQLFYSLLFLEDFLFSSNLCHQLVGPTVDLFMNCLFCSVDLFVCLYANTTPFHCCCFIVRCKAKQCESSKRVLFVCLKVILFILSILNLMSILESDYQFPHKSLLNFELKLY